jgi:hypothetical protein
LFRHHEGAIDEALGEIDASALLQIPGERFQNLAHGPRLHPAAEPPEAGRSGGEALRQVSPRGAGTQDPQHPVEHRAVIMLERSPAPVGPARLHWY